MKDDQQMQNPQDRQTRHELELAGPFLAILALMTVVAFLIPLRPETSVREKRKLREFPSFTVQSLLSGEYFDGISLWFSDTFPGRESMLEVSERMNALHGITRNEVVLNQEPQQNDNAELDALLEQAEATAAAGQKEALPAPSPEEEPAKLPEEEPAKLPAVPAVVDQNEVIENWEGIKGEDEAKIYGDMIVLDGTVMSRMGFGKAASDHHAALMNQAGDALAVRGIRFFNLPIPTSISILLSSDTLAELGAADQGKTLRYMFAQENENVGKVNAFNNLLAHNSEYLYFNTDHHWTARGAYYAYQAFCETAGFDAVPLEDFTERNMGEFLGSYSASVNTRKLKKDEVIALIPPGFENVHMEIQGYPHLTSPIVDEYEADPHMKYDCFIGGDKPLAILTNENLPDAPDCILIKDSFGNPFSIFLTQHYHKVYVLDYRKNFTPVSNVAEQYGVKDVILAQSIGVSQSEAALPLLDNLMK